MAGPRWRWVTATRPSRSHAIGNIVGNRRIAGLLFASQQGSNSSTGVITAIDYSTGNLKVDTGDPAHPATVQINDPNGRFGRAQSPDPRFSVDDANPTIHAGTGYPMCVPRTDPTVAGGDDPLCPQTEPAQPGARHGERGRRARGRRWLPQLQRRGYRTAHQRAN